jgi:hypothetical protein
MIRKSNLVPNSAKTFQSQMQLIRENFEFDSKNNVLIFHINWSKTIQYGERKLKIIVAAISGSLLCPVRAYLNMIDLTPSSSQSVDTIVCYYGDLIHKIKSKTDAKIIFTSLLPRLVDFKLSERKLNKVNSELRRLCNRRSLFFCNLYRSFLHNNKPDPSFYAPKDGLHLNFSGTELFRKKIIFIIKHLSL